MILFKKYFSKKLTRAVDHVCDPTLLFNEDKYRAAFGVENPQPSQTVLFYILDKDFPVRELTDVISRSGMPIDRIDHSNDSLHNFVQKFASSSFVFTDSYHGLMFSLIFRKGFGVLKNVKRGADRFDSILKIIGSEGCAFSTVEEAKSLWKRRQVPHTYRTQLEEFIKASGEAFIANLERH